MIEPEIYNKATKDLRLNTQIFCVVFNTQDTEHAFDRQYAEQNKK